MLFDRDADDMDETIGVFGLDDTLHKIEYADSDDVDLDTLRDILHDMKRLQHKPGRTVTKVLGTLEQRMVELDDDLMQRMFAIDDTAAMLRLLGVLLCKHVGPRVDFFNRDINVMRWKPINTSETGSFEVMYIDRNEPGTEHRRILLDLPVTRRSEIQVCVEEPSGSWAEQLAISGLSSLQVALAGFSPWQMHRQLGMSVALSAVVAWDDD